MKKRKDRDRILALAGAVALLLAAALLLAPAACAGPGTNSSPEGGTVFPEDGGDPVPPVTVTNITVGTRGTDQDGAAIWEDRIVWASRAGYLESGSYQSDLYLYNTTSGEETRLTFTPYDELDPDIWGDSVVWRAQAPEENSSEIHHLDLRSGIDQRITDDLVNQVGPAIWGDWIAWQEGEEWDMEHGIGLCHLPGMTVQRIGSLSAISPAIWEDRVVFADSYGGDDWNIYLYNLTSAIETQITSNQSVQTLPSIWGDLVGWQDYRDGVPGIYLYDIGTGTEIPFGGSEHPREDPAISGRSIVFLVRDGMDEDVWISDLSSNQSREVAGDPSGAAQYDPDLWGDRMVWTDGRNGDGDIFLGTRGISLPPLVAGLALNSTQGEPPLAVAFTDRSSGQVAGRLWDFGDGNSSRDQDPVHIYREQGTYSVTLTVWNPWQRDLAGEPDLVSVGTAPVPQFSADPVNGPAPLEVTFHDTSGGNPRDWLWDFGDGGSSGDKDPVHVYEMPGIYSVNLTVTNAFGSSTAGREDLVVVMDAARHTALLPSEGISVIPGGRDQGVVLDTTSPGTWRFDGESGGPVVTYDPPEGYGIAGLEFISETGFLPGGPGLLSGNLSSVIVKSPGIHTGDSTPGNGSQAWFNFTTSLGTYSPGGIIHVTTWEGVTPEDYLKFDRIASEAHFSQIQGVACTVFLEGENITPPGPSSFVFGVSSDWVKEHGWTDDRCLEIGSVPEGARVYIDTVFYGVTPLTVCDLAPGLHNVTLYRGSYQPESFSFVKEDIRQSIRVIRIREDGSGEVLTTSYIGHDPVHDLELFRAESPGGLSRLGLVSLSRSGNFFQMLYMSLSRVLGSSGGGGGGGGSSGGAVAGAGSGITPAPTVPVSGPEAPLPTVIPADDGPGGVTLPPPPTPDPGRTQAVEAPPGTVDAESPPLPEAGLIPEGAAAMILLRNLSVVAVAVILTAVFYVRWRKQEE